MAYVFSNDMTSEMIDDFKNWSRAIGGEGWMDGVDLDLKKYVQLGFCRNEFIWEMEHSADWSPYNVLYDPSVEEPEYTPEEWEQAKIDEVKEWKRQAKHSDHFYHETERLREERDHLKNYIFFASNTDNLGLKRENDDLKRETERLREERDHLKDHRFVTANTENLALKREIDHLKNYKLVVAETENLVLKNTIEDLKKRMD